MKHLLLLLCSLLVSSHAKTVEIDDNFTYTKASSFMEYTQENTHALSLDMLDQAQWRPMKGSNLDSFSSRASWTRFTLKNETSKNIRLILKNPNASMSAIDVYIIRKTAQEHLILGTNYPNIQRELNHRYSVMQLILDVNEEVQIVTKLRNPSGSVEGQWEIYSSNNFTDFSIFESMWWGIFIGIYSVIFLYIRPILSMVKNQYIIFSFTFFAVSCLLYQLSTNGILYSLGFHGNAINAFIVFFGSMFRLSTVLIMMNFIFMSYRKKILWWVFSFFIGCLSLILLLSFLTFFDATWLPVISKTSLIVGLLSYTVWIFLIKDIFTRAKSKIFIYVITAYTVILVPNAYQTFINAGFLEISFMSIYSVSIASIINLYLFGLAITEYIRTIERKRQYLEKMNEIQINYTSIGKIIGNITHQWKVPLVRAGSLLTQTEALIALKKDKALEEIHHEIVPALRENMEFMRETIDTFYALYKGDSTKSTFKPKDVLANIWGMLSAKAAALNVTLNATLSPRMSITSYEHHFGHLLMILLDNAIDTAKERTLTEAQLYVSIARDEEKLYLSVEDTCGGIAQTPIESIFELDVSSKESSTQQRGSGLYIFKTILDIKFGGTVTVRNNTHGARFDITIPFNAQGGG